MHVRRMGCAFARKGVGVAECGAVSLPDAIVGYITSVLYFMPRFLSLISLLLYIEF